MKTVIIGNSHLDQFKPRSYFSEENILQMSGASIRGLTNGKSTTGLNKRIDESKADAFIFHLGQVDMEFGYYYKSVLAGQKLNKKEFIESTINIYLTYLKTLHPSMIVIIGVNPTVIKDSKHIFSVNFEDSDTNGIQETGKGKGNNEISYESCLHIYNDSITERNEFLKEMNYALKNMCEENGFIFYDLWEELIDSDGVNIKPNYMPTRLDHHIVSSSTIWTKVEDILKLI